MAKTKEESALQLVPVVINVSEAGLGLRKGEVRGVSPEVAKRMFAKGTALPLSDSAKAKANKEVAESIAQGNKGLAPMPGFEQ